MASGLPAWLRQMNRVVVALAPFGLRMGPVRVLTVAGRTSGEPRSTPVTPIRVRGGVYAIAALPEGGWARNLRAAQTGSIRNGRMLTAVRSNELADGDLKRSVLAAFPAQAPQGVGFYRRLGLVSAGTPEEFASIAPRVAVFELTRVDG